VAHVVGREHELESIARFLDHVRDQPAALLIEGEAGIGKTTLWQAGVDRARTNGSRVLSSRAGQSEAKLSFTALSDLLEPIVDDALPNLPDPQRVALEVALVRIGSTDPSPDARAVSLAALGVFRSIAAGQPLVLAIDDLQWVDVPSARVLEFCLRRAAGEPIALLASVRLGTERPTVARFERALPAERVHRVTVGPMPADQIGRVIRARLGAEVPHPIATRIHEAAAGNPFSAVEIAREVLHRGAPAPGDPLPVPDDLAELPVARLTTLPKASREVLFVAAATSRPTLRVVRSASGLGARTSAALAAAETAGVVSVEEGTITFTHPLLASAAYASVSAEERRKVHRRLADHVDDPEERARHLALASEGPDAAVAEALDEAAGQARARGAPDAAAELADLARRLTPLADAEAMRRRTVEAAQHHFDAGDSTTAMALFEHAIAATPPGRARARILFLSGAHGWMDLRHVGRQCERALAEADADPEILTPVHDHLAWVALYRGDLAAASQHAASAAQHGGSVDSLARRAEAQATFGMVRFLTGRPAEALMAEADRLHDLAATDERGVEATVYTSAKTNHGLQRLWAGDLDAARSILQAELRRLEDRGRYLVRDEILAYLSEVECRAGRWDDATRYAEEAYEIGLASGRVSGEGHHLFNRALVAAHRGDVEAAKTDAEAGLRISIANDDPFYASENRWVLGFLELSRSNASAALEQLDPVLAYLNGMGSPEPGVIPCIPDAIEALVLLGEIDRAQELVDELEAKGRTQDRPWALATAGRCRALVLAARGDLDGGLQALTIALDRHQSVPQPFELGRTFLVKGEVDRRARRKRPARDSLREALAIFERLGARLWAERARAELERVGGAVVGPGGLTPTERRVAELVSQGKSNREVADALFISVKTVEANLSRVFHKLGVRSRAELIRRLVTTPDLET
jgi:DNA-binding CsgD family transcriptional regulator